MLPSLFFFCGASDGAVTLESPALPVAQGDNVTLRCRTQATFSPDVPANFYKDGLLVAGSPARSVTVHAVSAADQGLYRCDVSGAGGSAASRLAVRGEVRGEVTCSAWTSDHLEGREGGAHLHLTPLAQLAPTC